MNLPSPKNNFFSSHHLLEYFFIFCANIDEIFLLTALAKKMYQQPDNKLHEDIVRSLPTPKVKQFEIFTEDNPPPKQQLFQIFNDNSGDKPICKPPTNDKLPFEIFDENNPQNIMVPTKQVSSLKPKAAPFAVYTENQPTDDKMANASNGFKDNPPHSKNRYPLVTGDEATDLADKFTSNMKLQPMFNVHQV